jgi:long-chain acyl-CoA synthetase
MLENADKLPKLKAIVSMDSLYDTVPVPGATSASQVLRAWGAEKGIKVYDFNEIENLGKEFPRKHLPPQADEGTLCELLLLLLLLLLLVSLLL